VDGPCYTVALAHVVTSQVTQQPAHTLLPSKHISPASPLCLPTACDAHLFLCFVSSSKRRIALRDVVAGRCGEGSSRIVELLRAQMHTEQQHVAEKAIMPAREARVSACGILLRVLLRLSRPHHPLTHTSSSHPQQERLYRLHRDGWIQYLEVARRPDFAPVSTSYFWFVDVPKVSKRAHGPWPVRKAPRLAHLLRVCCAP
jgi:hypothetical protein